MIPRTTIAGPLWRIAPMGCARVYFHGLGPNGTATVSSKGQRQGRWALKPMVVAVVDLFLHEEEARIEYAVRKAAALARDPLASTNLSTPLQEARIGH